MNSIKLSLAAFVVVATFSGCGGGATLTPQQQQEVQQFDLSKIDHFAEKLHEGMNTDELLVYAPYSIELAQEYYQDALDAEKKDEKMQAYLQAKKALEDAYETKKMVKKYLSDVADIDKRMQAQNTKEIFADRYDNFQDDYKDLIVLIDKRETSQALEDKKTVMEEAKDLYGDAVVYRNINRAKIILENMEDDDLDELVPLHFEKAQKLYDSSRLRIKKEPDNREMVQRLAKETNDAAKYAQTLAKDVFHLRELNEDEQEAYFAKLHRRLAELNYKEQSRTILPLPIYEKIDYLQELQRVQPNAEEQKVVAVQSMEPVVESTEIPEAKIEVEVTQENVKEPDNNATVQESVEEFDNNATLQENVEEVDNNATLQIPQEDLTSQEVSSEVDAAELQPDQKSPTGVDNELQQPKVEEVKAVEEVVAPPQSTPQETGTQEVQSPEEEPAVEVVE